jgi:glycosyltransferase involved in cell wall biosynthesis
VLSTRNEGWANVFLEAMACGLPVIATDVGGNAEVVCRAELGSIVPFDDPAALGGAIQAALAKRWDRDAILRYAQDNDWNKRVALLVAEFAAIHQAAAQARNRRMH